TLPSQGFFADELMGSMVRSTSDDSEVGTVSDVILGDEGEIVAVIVTTGGVMGLGEREVSIAWDEIQRTGEGEEIELSVDMTNDELQDAPEFARN
ncbi:MAG: PRC-barrel domain-containing protein, partial [Natronospirillum sp.]